MTKEDKQLQDYLDTITAEYDECILKPYEIIKYMFEHDEMPYGLSLWEPLEYTSPRQLAEDWL